MSSPSREQLLQTTNLFLEAFNEFTPESVVRYRSPSCTHRIFPTILNSPTQTNADFANFVSALRPVMPALQFRLVGEPVVDEVARKVVLHLKSRSDTSVGLYQNEYVWILTFSQDGTSVDDMSEFVDSLYTSEWVPKLVKASEEATKGGN
ncbi:hypothetical protein AAE478_008349 [Parahypoxylon ruwenzoriense]